MKHKGTTFTTIALLTLSLGLLSGSVPTQAMSKDLQQRVLRASIKLLTHFDADEEAGSLCSGTLLNQEGYILTNFHCVGYATLGGPDEELDELGLEPGDLYNSDGLSMVAITDSPRQLPQAAYIAQVLTGDADLDLAVLKIVSYINGKQKLPKTLPLVYADLADSDTVETLDEVYVIGYPGIGGDTVTATQGKISGFIDEDEDDIVDWFKTDVLINQGNSGGSAMNDYGELVGVPTLRLRDGSGNVIYLVPPTNHAVPLIEQAMQLGRSAASSGKSVQRPGDVPGVQNIGSITFGTGFDDDGVTEAGTTFASGTGEIHAGVPYQNMRDGTRWGYYWQCEGQDVAGDINLKWQYGRQGVLDLYLQGKNGLAEGNYNLQVLINDAVVQEGQFAIGGTKSRKTPAKPQIVESEGVIVTGSVIDYSTRKPIQGAAVVFLHPGTTVDDFDEDTSEGMVDTVLALGVTNAKGRYTTDVPLPRDEVYSVIVGARGYFRIAEDDAVEITEDDPDLVELEPIELDRQ
jgi:serine protease Do